MSINYTQDYKLDLSVWGLEFTGYYNSLNEAGNRWLGVQLRIGPLFWNPRVILT